MKKLLLIFLVFVSSPSFCQDLQIENDLREEEFWDNKIKSSGITSLEIRSYDANESMNDKGTPYRLFIYNASGKKEKSYYFNPDSSINYEMTYLYDKENNLHKIKVIYKDALVKISRIKLNQTGLLASYKIVHPLDGYSSVKYEYTPEGQMNQVNLKIFSHYEYYNGKARNRRNFGYVPDREVGTKVEKIAVEFIYLQDGSSTSKALFPYAEVCQYDNTGNIIQRSSFINGKCIDSHSMVYNEKGLLIQNVLNVKDVPAKKFKFYYN
jgi:hypothetical protein